MTSHIFLFQTECGIRTFSKKKTPEGELGTGEESGDSWNNCNSITINTLKKKTPDLEGFTGEFQQPCEEELLASLY